MRLKLLIIWVLFLVVIFLVVNLYKRRTSLFNILFICMLLVVLFLGGNIINLNSLTKENEAKIEEVRRLVGDTYLAVSGGDIYVNVNGHWLNINDVFVVGEFTKDIVINYDGHDIYIGHSGVYNTLKVLQDVGLIKNKK